LFKRIFLLHSMKPGAMLKSGRNVIGHYPEQGTTPRNVAWLPGCCMSYRLSACRSLRFDDRLEGYSWGEDFDFSNSLSDDWRLIVEPKATCIHSLSPTNRMEMERLASGRTFLLHRWVTENRGRGYSRLAFWWSVAGEFALRAGHGIYEPSSRRIASGVLKGASRICVDSLRTFRQ